MTARANHLPGGDGDAASAAAPAGVRLRASTRPPEPPLEDPCAERELVRERLHDVDVPELDVFLSGTVFMDMIFTGLQAYPPPGTELLADGLGSAPGGVANIAVAMSRLGLKVGLAAAFGDDMFGAYLWRTLSEQEGVDVSLSRRLSGWPTPVTVSLACDYDRSMMTYRRPTPIPPHEMVTTPPRARTCYLHVDRGVPDWAVALRQSGATVVADVGWDPTEAWSQVVLDRLGHVDVFVPNAVEAMAYTRTATPEEALTALSSRVPVVAVKLGAGGAIATDTTMDETARAPALPVTALDTTGAGDVFTAGFVFGTLAGWPLHQRLRFANLCAGLSVRHYSGSLGAPCWGDIAAFGENSELPAEMLSGYSFVVDYIPEAADDSVPRADPTVGYGTSPADERP